MSSAILDGKRIEASEINPAIHRYIGMFRPAVDPASDANCSVMCPCGKIQQFREEGMPHYHAGHWDLPQYVTIEVNKS